MVRDARLGSPAGAVVAAISLAWGALMPQQTRAHQPAIPAFHQRNVDESPVGWLEISAGNEITLSVTAQLDAPPNSCPPRALLDVEFRRAHDSFVNQPTNPEFLARTCSGLGTCTVTFGHRLVDKLDPGTAYKWQARVTAIYDWETCNNFNCTCGPESRRYTSNWERIGLVVPGYFSFRTPKTYTARTAVPRAVSVPVGTLIAGDASSVAADDNQWLQARAMGNPRTFAVQGIVPIPVEREVRAFKGHVAARSSRACNMTIDAWNRRTKTWTTLKSAMLPTQETMYGGLEFAGGHEDYLLDDTSATPSNKIKDLKYRLSCVRTGTLNFDAFVEQIMVTYEQADQ